MRRATPLGHERNTPAPNQEQHPNPALAETPSGNDTNDTNDTNDSDEAWARRFSIVRGGAPAERPRRTSGEQRKRVSAVIQPSDPDRLRRALEALREMNKLTRRRTEEMRKLSVLSRELSEQMTAFGSAMRGLKIGPQRRSVG